MMVAMAMLATEANAQAAEQELAQLSTVIGPLRPGVTESQVFAGLAAHNERCGSASRPPRLSRAEDLSGR